MAENKKASKDDSGGGSGVQSTQKISMQQPESGNDDLPQFSDNESSKKSNKTLHSDSFAP